MAFLFPWPPGPSPAQRCEADKNQAAGVKTQCLAEKRAREVEGRTPNFARCEARFTKAFAAAERKAGPGVCPTEGDTAAIEAQVDAAAANLAAALSGSTPPATHELPATGQMTCGNSAAVIPCTGTGQDEDIKAGALLSYKDNGDGRITDNNTGLMWAKQSADGTIHDKDATYTWITAITVHIAELNAGHGFAGCRDWRVPKVSVFSCVLPL